MPPSKLDDRDDVYSGMSSSARKRAHSRELAYRSRALEGEHGDEPIVYSPTDSRLTHNLDVNVPGTGVLSAKLSARQKSRATKQDNW